MARPKDPRAAAARIRTEVAASRLNDELETELAMGDADPEWARRAEDARADLASRFGGYDRLHEIARDRPVGTSESRRPRRSSASTGPHGGRRRAGSPEPPTPPAAPPAGRAPASPRKPAPRTTRPARSSRRASSSGRGAGQRAFRQTGIPGAAGSSAAFALQVLGLMIGMALLYLVLTDAERARKGAGIFGTVLTGATSLMHRFISPGDPLATKRSNPPPTSAAGVPILQPSESNAHFDQRMNTYLRSRAQPDTSAGAVLQGTAQPIGGFPDPPDAP
jgi:hypothetical protein